MANRNNCSYNQVDVTNLFSSAATLSLLTSTVSEQKKHHLYTLVRLALTVNINVSFWSRHFATVTRGESKHFNNK